jgi:hypothetical protein
VTVNIYRELAGQLLDLLRQVPDMAHATEVIKLYEGDFISVAVYEENGDGNETLRYTSDFEGRGNS